MERGDDVKEEEFITEDIKMEIKEENNDLERIIKMEP